MKLRHLSWSQDEDGHTTLIYDSQMGWFTGVAFFKDGLWRLNSENKDPSEQLATAGSLEEIKQKAQEFHNSGVKADFF